MWLNGPVVSALGIRARWPGFKSRVAPLFHWVATLGKLFTHTASPVSQLQETGVQKESFRRLSGYGYGSNNVEWCESIKYLGVYLQSGKYVKFNINSSKRAFEAPMFCTFLYRLITVTMVFYLNLCFIVNLMPFTVSGQPFRTMLYISMHFFLILLLCVLLFRVYSL